MAAPDFVAVDSQLVDTKADLDLSTIEDFLEFSTAELKFFLLNLGESIAGCRAELAERAVLAQQRKKNAGPSEPKKFKIEREEAKGEYASVLEEYGLTDPDVANEWSVDISGLPNLDVGKIFHYILTKEAFDTYYLSEYKTKKAYQYLESVCVRSIQVHVAADFIFVKGTIAPLSESGDGFDARKPPNIVKVVTTSDNDVVVSCCTCTSNLYQCCNHVIAVLFRIERLVGEMDSREPMGKTPEQDPDQHDNFKPVKISDLFKKKDPLAQTLLGKIHKPSAEEKRRFMEKICHSLPNSLFAQMFKGSIASSQAPAPESVTPAAQVSPSTRGPHSTLVAQSTPGGQFTPRVQITPTVKTVLAVQATSTTRTVPVAQTILVSPTTPAACTFLVAQSTPTAHIIPAPQTTPATQSIPADKVPSTVQVVSGSTEVSQTSKATEQPVTDPD